MLKVLITGTNSFVGTSVESWLNKDSERFQVDTVDTMNRKWEMTDFSKYDVVFHVAGIAHVDPKPHMAPLYYSVNRDLAIEIAAHAKEHGVRQFIYMSSKIVYHSSKSLHKDVIDKHTPVCPNDFYGDSKLQAEKGLLKLNSPDFKIAILRPPMIYGPGNKGNLPRLAWLATKIPIFPNWHNKRSMLHVNNLAEFVKQVMIRHMDGIFFPQDPQLSDTVELVRFFAKEHNHKIFISSIFNPLVWIGAKFLKSIPKMFADSYYKQEMSKYDFDYQVISYPDSLKSININRNLK